MKKYFPFIVGAAVLALLVLLMMNAGNNGRQQRRIDKRITLRQKDKIPYGTRVARELLSSLFPDAKISYGSGNLQDWKVIELYEPNQAVVLMTDYFDPEPEELTDLSDFVEEGNYVFIISRTASDAAASFFELSYRNSYYGVSDSDSLKIKLSSPSFTNTSLYTYPGIKYEGAFYSVDTDVTQVLGENQKGETNFISLKKGKGAFYLHSVPMAFSNYFVLHKNNAAYYEQVFSVLPKDIAAIHWNEYFLGHRSKSDNDSEPNWLGALLKYPSFKWGLLLAALTLLLFLLLGMRRRQRMIPLIEKPKNDSLDFVKTLGRLYHDRRDHKNLTNKMTAYFLEHVRSKYKLPTHTLDDSFISSLHFKSGYPESETQRLVNTINETRITDVVSDAQLTNFYKLVEAFYQNT